MSEIEKLVELGLAGGVTVITVTRSSIFKPLREKLDEKSQFFGDLTHCPYCFGHWTGFLLTTIFDLRLFNMSIGIANWFFSALALTWLSIVMAALVFQAANFIPLHPHGEDDNGE